MSAREELLVAGVYAAFDARGSDDFRAARERLVDGWYLWPLIEYEHALERARQTIEDEHVKSEWRIAEAVAAIRDSYLPESVAA